VYQCCENAVNELNMPMAYVGDQLMGLTEKGWHTINSSEFWRNILKNLSRGYRDTEFILKKNLSIPYDISADRSVTHYYKWDRMETGDDGKGKIRPMWEGQWVPINFLAQDEVVMADGFFNLSTGNITHRNAFHTPIFGPVVSISVKSIGVTSPEWEEVLDIFLPNPAHRAYLQEVFGLILLPHYSSKSFISVYGPPGSGKSTFINACTVAAAGMVGRASCNPDLFASNQFKCCSLLGKFSAVAEEFESLSTKGKNWLKAYTGGELAFEVKYGANGVATPSAKFIGVSNTLPDFLEDTYAIMDRMILAPFYERITNTAHDDPAKQRKRDMAYWCEDRRRAAVISWMLEGAMRVVQRGYRVEIPQWIKQERQRIRLETHPVLSFLEDTFEAGDADDRLTAADLKVMLENQKLGYPRKQILGLLSEIAPEVKKTKRAKKDGDSWAPAAGFTHIRLRRLEG